MKKFYVDVSKRFEDDGVGYLNALGLDYELISRPKAKSRFLLYKDKHDEGLFSFISFLAVRQGAFVLAVKTLEKHNPHLKKSDLAQIKLLLKTKIEQEEKRLMEAVRWDLKHLSWVRSFIDIEGYLHFAAHGLERCLKLLAAAETEAYLLQKEEEDFAEVLRFFVEMQESSVAEVHLFLDGRQFEIKDQEGNDLRKMYLTSMALENEDINSINQEDLIMSILITLVPEKIIVHYLGEKDERILKMTEAVFGDRLEICTGCAECQNPRLKSSCNFPLDFF